MESYIAQFTDMAVLFAPRLALGLLTLIIGFWIAGKVSHIVSHALHQRKVEETVIPFLVSIISVVLKVMVLISV
ncbi:MAG TPA: hypothetical protein PK228_17540, partial [Saprospiraceae bacterium]|nr:hypothetical protein [Saprospiraceae bacterium]